MNRRKQLNISMEEISNILSGWYSDATSYISMAGTSRTLCQDGILMLLVILAQTTTLKLSVLMVLKE